jgi:hypothetical protein
MLRLPVVGLRRIARRRPVRRPVVSWTILRLIRLALWSLAASRLTDGRRPAGVPPSGGIRASRPAGAGTPTTRSPATGRERVSSHPRWIDPAIPERIIAGIGRRRFRGRRSPLVLPARFGPPPEARKGRPDILHPSMPKPPRAVAQDDAGRVARDFDPERPPEKPAIPRRLPGREQPARRPREPGRAPDGAARRMLQPSPGSCCSMAAPHGRVERPA